ncbi:MAG: hypothetical protein K8L97_18135 [Anaerolineae bacterium]|nr:hypothetical protein [Anaerolineae bacterium]
MLSWKLWQNLQHQPHQNPIFRWTMTRRVVDAQGTKWLIIVGMALLIGLGVVAIAARLQLVTLLLAVMTTPALVLGVAVVIALLYCTGLSGAISSGIHRVREQQIYDMLCLTPPGIFGVTWTIAAGISHRRQGFFWFRLFVQTVAGSLIIGMALTLGVSLLVMILSHAQEQAVALEIINVLLLCMTVYIGCIQAFTSSILIGMIAPLLLSENMPLYFITVGVYLLIEMYVLLLMALIGLLLIPVAVQSLPVSGFAVEMALPFLRVAIFCGLHEVINRILWRVLRERLDTAEALPVL